MAIYSPRRARWPLMLGVAAVALLIGVVIGALLFGSKPIDVAAAAEQIAAQTSASAGLLEVVEIEYTEAAQSNFAGTELQAALDNLGRSRERYDTVRQPLLAIDATRVGRIEAGFTQIERLLVAHADPAAVHSAIEELTAELAPR